MRVLDADAGFGSWSGVNLDYGGEVTLEELTEAAVTTFGAASLIRLSSDSPAHPTKPLRR